MSAHAFAFDVDPIRSRRRHARGPRTRFSYLVLLSIYALILGLYLCSTASARPTQQDVFRSIEENVGESHDGSGRTVMFVCIGAGLLLILVLFGRRQTREASPKALHHHGKLLKELRAVIGLKKSELKQLKAVADRTVVPGFPEGHTVSSPLVLLLCPSALAKATQDRSVRVDRAALARILRRLEQR